MTTVSFAEGGHLLRFRHGVVVVPHRRHGTRGVPGRLERLDLSAALLGKHPDYTKWHAGRVNLPR
jgi:hypothetical protein